MRTNKSGPVVIVGLGNPGPQYADTRHNVGYKTVDKLLMEPPVKLRRRFFASYAAALSPGGEGRRDIAAIRFSGYMNNSGDILPSVLHRYGAQPEDLVIVVDNMDLPPGACRIRRGGGHAGHNGLKSAAAKLETTDFLRLYVGVGRPEKGTTFVEHVLGAPNASDSKAMDEAMNRAVQALNMLRYMPLDRVAEELNRRR